MHIRQGLAGHRLGKEDHEIDRVALVHRHADLAVALEPADPRPVPGARVDHDHRRLGRIDAIVPAIVAHPRDPEQSVVGGPLEIACVKQKLVVEIQQRRHALPLMRDHVVGAFAQRLEEQNPTFEGVLGIGRVRAGACATSDRCRGVFGRIHHKAQALVHVRFPFDWGSVLEGLSASIASTNSFATSSRRPVRR